MTSNATERRVLCVDDEPFVLEGLTRTLFEHFEVTTFTDPLEALRALESPDRPFAVVVSDMRMPEMSGDTFLAHARKAMPDTTRILLTGQLDVDAAIAAVNKGHIFRFLCKPCAPDELLSAIQAGAEQNRLVSAERELLEQTLTGSIRLFSEVLGLIAPGIFARTQRVKAYMLHMTARLELPDAWRMELAALLSMVGCVGLPEQTLERILSGRPLDGDEKRVFEQHPATAYRLLSGIPRFGEVAQMIRGQLPGAEVDHLPEDIRVGAKLLRLAREIDHVVSRGASLKEALPALVRKASEEDRRYLETLSDYNDGQAGTIQSLPVSAMTAGMILEDDVRTASGVVVIPRGRELTLVLLERLWNFTRVGSLLEPVKVRVVS